MKENVHDVAQLTHVEIFSPKVDESVAFFKNLLGMSETMRDGKSVYLRAYEDHYHHSLKITERDTAGMAQMGWRADSEAALHRRVEAIEKTGLGRGWIDNESGYGRAYEYTTPDGHVQRLLWEIEYYEAPPELKSGLLSRPQKRPIQGVPVRRLDHVNLMASDVTVNSAFYQEAMGLKVRENILVADGAVEVGAWLSSGAMVHEVAIMRDDTGAKGRLHHVAFWYGYPQHLSDIADVCRDHDIRIEVGPGKHGITQAMFLYVFEPGGNRIELFGDAGYLIFDPTWKTRTWTEETLEEGIIWTGPTLPQEFFLYGTPDVGMAPEGEPVASEEMSEASEAAKNEPA